MVLTSFELIQFTFNTYCIYVTYFIQNTYITYEYQEGDQWTCEAAPACHRCPATKQQFLATHCSLPLKSTKETRAAITAAASGDGLRTLGVRGVGRGSVVEWNEDGSGVRPGPEKSHYEISRAECGAHLLFNAFWAVANCCIHQLLMKDPMHQMDLGVIVRLIMAILRKYWECVLQFLKEGNEGLAAKKLQARLDMVLAHRTGKDGRM